MNELLIGKILIEIALIMAATYLVGGLLIRLRIPVILGPVLIAMGVHFTAAGNYLQSAELAPIFQFLSDLGVLFLLFFIGLQIDLQEMREQSRDIIWATVLNTAVPFLLGSVLMLALGYGWITALVIGMTTMPTAEAVIVPILDEFQLIRTRVGRFIIGAGVLDDIIEVFLVALVSIWIGERTTNNLNTENEAVGVFLSLIIFTVTAFIAYRWLLPIVAGWLPRRPRNLALLAVCVLFGFGGFSAYSSLGIVVGAIVAGVLMRPVFNQAGQAGEQTTRTIEAISYGFFGILFFFWVGLSVDIEGMLREPLLAVLLFLAAFVGKLAGILLMIPMGKLAAHEAWIIGIGINARLTTEIIVAKLLFDAKLIDNHLFTALIASSSLSTIIVPLTFTFLVRHWEGQLLRNSENVPQGEKS